MITIKMGSCNAYCDNCGQSFAEEHEEFKTVEELMSALEASKWQIGNSNSEFIELCQDCRIPE